MKKTQLLGGLKKATIEMLLLRMLMEQDMYGYQMTQELKKRSSGRYTVLEGSMYPILYRLCDQGYITSYEKKVGKRLTRVYYRVEEEGRKYYEGLLRDYEEFLDLISFLLDSKEGDVCQ